MEMLAWVLLGWWPGQLCPPSSWSTVLLTLPGTALLFHSSQLLPLPLTEGAFCSPVRMGLNAVNPSGALWADPEPCRGGGPWVLHLAGSTVWLSSGSASRSVLVPPGYCQDFLTSTWPAGSLNRLGHLRRRWRQTKLASSQFRSVFLRSLVSCGQTRGCCACLDTVPICLVLHPHCQPRTANNTACVWLPLPPPLKSRIERAAGKSLVFVRCRGSVWGFPWGGGSGQQCRGPAGAAAMLG